MMRVKPSLNMDKRLCKRERFFPRNHSSDSHICHVHCVFWTRLIVFFALTSPWRDPEMLSVLRKQFHHVGGGRGCLCFAPIAPISKTKGTVVSCSDVCRQLQSIRSRQPREVNEKKHGWKKKPNKLQNAWSKTQAMPTLRSTAPWRWSPEQDDMVRLRQRCLDARCASDLRVPWRPWWSWRFERFQRMKFVKKFHS